MGDIMFKYTLDNKRYYTLNYYNKTKYNSKVFKVSLNAGFGCPNKKNGKGCIYCYDGSGENRGMSLVDQFYKVKSIVDKKWPNSKYIGYFQADTNTYAPLQILKKNYVELLVPFKEAGENKGRQLLDTLETFVLDAGMNSSKTAEFMGIHANTVQYRLKKINEMLGVEVTGNRVIPGLTMALALKRIERVVS